MTKSIDLADKKIIIENAINSISYVQTKTYMNNSFAVSLKNEKDLKNFEKVLQPSVINAMNKYLEDKKLDPKEYARALSYTVHNTGKNAVITF